jgi:hypothetical protein
MMRILEPRLQAPLRALAIVILAICPSMALQARTLYVDLGLAATCTGTTYSVSAHSCTGADGLGYSAPNAAIAAMLPGDSVIMRAGVYTTPLVVSHSGTPDAHLLITVYPGEIVVIDAGATATGTSAVWVQSQSYVDISGLVIRNAPYYGFKGDASTNVTFSDSEVAFSGAGGIIFQSASNVIVSHCRVHHNNLGGPSSAMEAISIQDTNQFQVTNSMVYDNIKEGIDSKYGSTNGIISGNELYRNHATNIYLDGTSYISVFDNISHDNVSTTSNYGISVAMETPTGANWPTRNISIHNNIFYGNGAAIDFYLETPSDSWCVFSNITITNNTIADNNLTNWGGIYLMNGTARTFGPGNTIQNNIFWNNTVNGGARSIRDDAGVIGLFTVMNNFFQQSAPSATNGTSSATSAQVPFVNESTHDYHLVIVTPARNAGTPAPGITTDMDGIPVSSPPDAGAFQYSTK